MVDILTVGASVAGGAAALSAVTIALPALGFTAAGVTASSYAAGMMSTYGGTIATGSLVSTLQSVGAAGLSLAGKTVVAGVGAAGGALLKEALS